MLYKLYYGELPMDTDVQEYNFDTFSDLTEFIQSKTRDKHRTVFLYQYGKYSEMCHVDLESLENPIIITPSRDKLLQFVFNNRLYEHHIVFEQESFIDSFAIAKDLVEYHPLCYNKDKSDQNEK